MNMTKKRVSELEGAQLDWAVAKAEGLDPYYYKPLRPNAVPGVLVDSIHYYPSIGWECGGPLVEREHIGLGWWALSHLEPKAAWRAVLPSGYTMRGPTPLIAAMRALVGSELGDEVEVPE